MTKSTKVTEQEMFEMIGMFVSGKGVTEISKATGRSKPTVEKYISELKKEQEKEQASQDEIVAEASEETEQSPTKRKNTTHFLRKTAEKKIKGVSIMTGAESARGEATPKKTGAKNPKYLKTIHKINEE